jgi:ABC-type transport system involved in multi-copper enzyme maturation permease subunit
MIKTDWLATKSHHWRFLMLVALTGIICFSGLGMMIITLGGYMGMTLSSNAFEVEEKGKLEHLYLTLPLTRKSIVFGRFAFMLACVTCVFLFTSVLTFFTTPTLELGTYKYDVEPRLIMLLCASGFALSGLINLSMYPVLFRLGYEKGKGLGLYIPLGIFALIFFAVTAIFTINLELIISYIPYWFSHMATVSLILVVVGIMLYYLSYRLSLRMYSRRSF